MTIFQSHELDYMSRRPTNRLYEFTKRLSLLRDAETWVEIVKTAKYINPR